MSTFAKILQPRPEMIINGDKKYGILLLMLGMVLGMMAQGDEREFYVFDASNGLGAIGSHTVRRLERYGCQ